jgi:hypothetical protein
MSKAPQPSPFIELLYFRANSVDEVMSQLPPVGSLRKFPPANRPGLVYQVSEIEIEVLQPSILDAIFFRKPKWLAKVHYRRPVGIELPCPPPPPRKP